MSIDVQTPRAAGACYESHRPSQDKKRSPLLSGFKSLAEALGREAKGDRLNWIA